MKPRFARISLNPPSPGDLVRVFGFPDSSVEGGTLFVSPSECVARVREVAFKSKVPIRPASYVELEGEIQGGMSGGPCFDSHWNVIGMAAKGWHFLEEAPSEPPLSYMALLWPAMSIPIDLFKTGKFPAWDLFKTGPAQAVGHRRVHVTAGGQVQFGAVDPDSLVPLSFQLPEEHLAGALNFAAENARQALVDLQTWSGEASNDAAAGDPNRLHRALRHFFWELDASLRISMRLVAARVGFALDTPVEWDRFVQTWRDRGASPSVQDALAALRFSWQGIDLFEIRTYAEQAKGGVLIVQCGEAGGRIAICMLSPCRKGGGQIAVPDGLERYFTASRQFTQSLMRIARDNAGERHEGEVGGVG